MTLPLWGMMQKAQDDPETIEQAIARMIAEHEADPEAHLGEGESLSMHKHEEIIDHPAQSVVLDKTPFRDYEEFIGDLGAHEWSAEVGSFTSNTDRLKASNLFSQSSFAAIATMFYPLQTAYPDADLMMQFRLVLGRTSNTADTLEFGWTDDILFFGTRMVFKKDGNDWKWQLYDNGTLVHSYTISSSTLLTKYYRIYFDSTAQKIQLFIGTTVASEYETEDWKKWILTSMQIEMSKTSGAGTSWLLTDWKCTFAQNIDI